MSNTVAKQGFGRKLNTSDCQPTELILPVEHWFWFMDYQMRTDSVCHKKVAGLGHVQLNV